MVVATNATKNPKYISKYSKLLEDLEINFNNIEGILEKKLFKDAKSSIQEYIQAEFDITPNYKVLKEEWPDHNKSFTVWVYMWEKILWEWSWTSKKKAEESAAENAYCLIQKK